MLLLFLLITAAAVNALLPPPTTEPSLTRKDKQKLSPSATKASAIMSIFFNGEDNDHGSILRQQFEMNEQETSLGPLKFESAPISSNSKQKQQSHARKRGRPGIVVFSGGTAFNAAASEMASRNNFVSADAEAASSPSATATSSAMTSRAALAGDDSRERSAVSQNNSLVNTMKATTLSTTMTTDATSIPKNSSNMIEGGGIKVWHVLPVTDDGGSTAEIVRVLGGPAVGDIRSRLLRLAPGHTREGRAVRRLLGHRLVSLDTIQKKHLRKDGNDVGNDYDDGGEISADVVSRMAREEWLDIIDGGLESSHHHNHRRGLRHHSGDSTNSLPSSVNTLHTTTGDDNDEESASSDGEHPLWKGVSSPYRSIIRAFLVHFHTQVMTHNGMRSSHPPFDFTGGSVGNFFFAGARTFFGSLPAAIFLFSKVANIPSGSRVLPAVLSEERLVLGAVLKDGTRLRGQYEISHPSPRQLPTRLPSNKTKEGQRDRSGSFKAVVKSFDSCDGLHDGITSLHTSEMSRVCYLLHDPTFRRKGGFNNITKDSPRSTSKVRKDWTDRHEVDPEPNPLVLEAISNANCIVYGCGSLFTSVLPSLVLRGVGEEIVRKAVPKVLLLNGWHDHETTWAESSSDGSIVVKRMDATSVVQAVVNAFDRGISWDHNDTDEDNSDDGRVVTPVPLITDYITHVFYPIGSEIEINQQSIDELCSSRQRSRLHQVASEEITAHLNNKLTSIKVIGIASIPADECAEGKRSGGGSQHRIFDAGALVDALLGKLSY